MPIVVILAALIGGLLTLVLGWSPFGFYALIVASAVASAVGVLVGVALAYLGRGGARDPSDATGIFGVAGLTDHRQRDLRLVPKRLYFDIEHGQEIIKDEVGIEAASLETALDDARSVIREMIDDLADEGYAEDWVLVVRDAKGASVARLPIARPETDLRPDRRTA
jgi:hypothetical protein